MVSLNLTTSVGLAWMGFQERGISSSGCCVTAGPTCPGWALQRQETWKPKGWSPLFRSQQSSSQKTRQLKKSKEAHAKAAISWPEVEEVSCP